MEIRSGRTENLSFRMVADPQPVNGWRGVREHRMSASHMTVIASAGFPII
ncbi:hypothetical protein SXCC_03680 [Gluconacetobacter sp. SXCC-1]|nr:hypothetical protein SXCC_03680 [Gluconacetobacter sp. SXCC-1]